MRYLCVSCLSEFKNTDINYFVSGYKTSDCKNCENMGTIHLIDNKPYPSEFPDEARLLAVPENYTLEWFRDKFEAIPEKYFCKAFLSKKALLENGGELNQFCALGFCGVHLSDDMMYVYTDESIALEKIFQEIDCRLSVDIVNDGVRDQHSKILKNDKVRRINNKSTHKGRLRAALDTVERIRAKAV